MLIKYIMFICATQNKSRECVPRKHWNSFIDSVSNTIHCALEILVNIDVYRATPRHYDIGITKPNAPSEFSPSVVSDTALFHVVELCNVYRGA